MCNILTLTDWLTVSLHNRYQSSEFILNVIIMFLFRKRKMNLTLTVQKDTYTHSNA